MENTTVSHRKSHILVECPELLPSVRVGVLAVLAPLEERGVCQVKFCETKGITKEHIAWCDILICVRGCEYPTYRIVESAKRAGKFVVYFLDDDLLHVPFGNSFSAYCYDLGAQMNLPRTLSICDVLWTVNERVAKDYGKYCARSFILRVPAKIRKAAITTTSPLRVVYAGSVDHSNMAKEQLVPAVERLLAEYPGQIEFTFMGVNPQMGPHTGVKQISFFSEYEAYQKAMSENGFSVGLAPAYRTDFYASKYYNKFIEYSSFGIVGIYADCKPYTQIVKDGVNGFLCGETAQDWYFCLKHCIETPDLLENIAKTAQQQLIRDFDGEVIAKDILKKLPELLTFRAIENEKIILPPMWWLFYWERVLLTLRMNGWKSLWIIPYKVCKVLWKKARKH